MNTSETANASRRLPPPLDRQPIASKMNGIQSAVTRMFDTADDALPGQVVKRVLAQLTGLESQIAALKKELQAIQS